MSFLRPRDRQARYQNTAGILVGAATNKVKRLVYCSSMARYGHGNHPLRVEPAAPVDPYGISKYAGELLRRECRGDSWHRIHHRRAANIIVPRPKYDDAYRNSPSIMINRMLRGSKPVITVRGTVPVLLVRAGLRRPLGQDGDSPGLSGEIINIRTGYRDRDDQRAYANPV